MTAITDGRFDHQPRWYRVWYGKASDIFVRHNNVQAGINESDLLGLYLVNTENVMMEGLIKTVVGSTSIWTKNDTLKLSWTVGTPNITATQG